MTVEKAEPMEGPEHECCRSCTDDILEGYGDDILACFECCCKGPARN